MPLGYFVERGNDCYVAYNPDLQRLLQVYLGEQPVAVPYYIPGYRFYFASDDSDCSGQAYVIFHDGYHHMQDIMKDLNWVNNQAAYKVDFTQQPLSATNMGYSIYGLPDTGVCEPYDVDSTAFPIVPIDFPTTLLNLQYPIEVKPMQ